MDGHWDGELRGFRREAEGISATHGTLPLCYQTHTTHSPRGLGTGDGSGNHFPGGSKVTAPTPSVEMFPFTCQIWAAGSMGGASQAEEGASHTSYLGLAWKFRSQRFLKTFEKLAS